MQSKKILYIVSTLKRSGPTNQLYYLIKYLEKSKFTPHILTLSPETDESDIEMFKKINVPIHSLDLSRFEGVFKTKKLIRKKVREISPNLIHSQGIRSDYIANKFLKGTPHVATLRNYPFKDYTMRYGKIKGGFMARAHLKILKKVDAPYVVSQSISRMLKTNKNFTIDFLRNGTDEERFNNLNKVKLREKFNIQDDKKVFISVGHLISLKDPLTIIKAFKKANIVDSMLFFLGNGNLKEKCLEEIGNSNNILLIGKVDNVPEYLGMSDYFISSSLTEGLPNTVMEAMAAGVPCILSDIQPHLEIHNLNKKSSLIFKTKKVDDLAEKIKILTADNNYDAMSAACKKTINNHLSAKIMSENYQRIYLELINNVSTSENC